MCRVGAALLLAVATACTDPGMELEVELRTDFLPGDEFVSVQTTIEGGPTEAEPATALDDFRTGVRVASFDGLSAGTPLIVEVVLRNDRGVVVITDRTRLMLDGDFGLTVVISRRCAGVRCPSPSDACYNGMCAPLECRPGLDALCPACSTATDCGGGGGPPCVVPLCAEGECLVAARDDLCPPGSRCHPLTGCSTTPDAGPTVDAGGCRGDSDCPDDAVETSGCYPTGALCASTGVDTHTTTRWECIGGNCQSSEERTDIPCTLDPEGEACTICSRCQSGTCAPFDGTVCFLSAFVGECYGGECCIFCWDGTTCQTGDIDTVCGRDGELCTDCTATGLTCGPGGYCR